MFNSFATHIGWVKLRYGARSEIEVMVNNNTIHGQGHCQNNSFHQNIQNGQIIMGKK